MGYAASLMLGWTVLLFWAYRRPLERRFVAALTIVVVVGLVVTEVVAVHSNVLEARRLVPTWCLQAFLLALLGGAYRYGRRVEA
jgi:peptidoglycan/LPS O-acetylase OafA/YrhL